MTKQHLFSRFSSFQNVTEIMVIGKVVMLTLEKQAYVRTEWSQFFSRTSDDPGGKFILS